MVKIEPEKPRLGVSACLLGEAVRHDGGHKRDAVLVEVLGAHVQWVPVCPEVELGLGVPRDTIRLVRRRGRTRLEVERTGEDLTTRMRRFAERRARELAALGLDGYVLKSGSPSCGLRVPVHDTRRARTAPGAWAAILRARLPGLLVEEEGRLADPAIRRRFLARVTIAHRKRLSLRPAANSRADATRRPMPRRRQ